MREAALSRWVYQCSYCVSYGATYPTVLLASSLPADSAAVRGMAEGSKAGALRGAAAARRLAETAGAARSYKPRGSDALADAYCAVAKKAALAIERIEDRLAERRAASPAPRLALH
jgi:hypothetical protein